MTHDPPLGILDGKRKLQDISKLQPAYHCFGQVHEARGKLTVGSTAFINAANACGGMNPKFLQGGAAVFDLMPRASAPKEDTLLEKPAGMLDRANP